MTVYVKEDPKHWTGEKIVNAMEIIIQRMCEGESVNRILDPKLRDNKVLPSYFTFCVWLSDSPDLAKSYAYACKIRADLMFEEIISIADEKEDETIREVSDTFGSKTTTKDALQHRRNRIDVRKFAIGKLNPEKYNDKYLDGIGGHVEQPLFTDFDNTDNDPPEDSDDDLEE